MSREDPIGEGERGQISSGGPCAALSFEDWYAEHGPKLVGAARLMVRDGGDVEDLVVDACVKLMVRWDDRRPANPMAWVLTVVVNARRRQWRTLGRQRDRLHLVARPEQVANVEPDVDLEAAIRDLPERQRTAVALRYGSGLSQAEIAEVMGVAPGTASALLNQARANLRKRLETTDDR